MQWNAFGDKKLMISVIHLTILKEKFKDEEVLILRIPMIPTDMSFEIKRIQSPIHVTFAMMINISQGQVFSVCGLNLENPFFFSWPIMCGMFMCW